MAKRDTFEDLADLDHWSGFRKAQSARRKAPKVVGCFFCLAVELYGHHDDGCPVRPSKTTEQR